MARSSDDLSWLIYTSFATDGFDEAELAELLQQCRAANRERDVTGLLLFRDQRFLQVLEGPKSALEPLMRTIADDLRHFDVYVLLDEPLAARRFPDWAMGYQGPADGAGPWPEDYVDTFRRVTGDPFSDENMQAIDELLDGFRSRAGVGEAVPV